MKPTRKIPLFIVTGASCVGKSTMCEILFQKEKDYVVMESDLLWMDFFNTPQDDYCLYRRLWMRMCASISQIGLPVVLCGCGVPDQFEKREERELFDGIYYLALVCQEEELYRRATQGRGVREEHMLSENLSFNRWLRENCDKTNPPMTLLDTTCLTPGEAAEKADRWIREKLAHTSSFKSPV